MFIAPSGNDQLIASASSGGSRAVLVRLLEIVLRRGGHVVMVIETVEAALSALTGPSPRSAYLAMGGCRSSWRISNTPKRPL
jgi:hypothetical protein